MGVVRKLREHLILTAVIMISALIVTALVGVHMAPEVATIALLLLLLLIAWTVRWIMRRMPLGYYLFRSTLGIWHRATLLRPFEDLLADSMRSGELMLKACLGCKFIDYSQALAQLTRSERVNRLLWTNIYPPRVLLCPDLRHRSLFMDQPITDKRQVHIIGSDNICDWLEDMNQGRVIELEEAQRRGGCDVRYVWEGDLRDSALQKALRLGDYAIFNDEIVLSFNPHCMASPPPEQLGDMHLGAGHLDAYPNIFDFAWLRGDRTFAELRAQQLENGNQEFATKESDGKMSSKEKRM